MAGFEREFIIHLQTIGENSDELCPITEAVKEKKDSKNVYRRLMRKYRKQWWGSGSSRRKFNLRKTKKIKKGILQSREEWMRKKKNETTWSKFHSRDNTLHSNAILHKETGNFSSSLMKGETHCTDFPITGMAQEFSGIRDNGNSPFNSSNSCGSPEGLSNQEPPTAKAASVTSTDTKTCCEQNNNSQNNGCLCRVKKQCDESQLPKVPDSSQQQTVNSEETLTLSSETLQLNPPEGNDDLQYDVQTKCDESESLLKEQSCNCLITCKHSVADSLEANESNNVSNIRTSSRRKSVLTPIAWQQQFMSFLSTTQEEDPFSSNDPDFVCNVRGAPAKVSRRRRSRNVKSSSCACCVDAESHNKKERQSRQREKKIFREQKHFIQDMMQLVSLRNKIVVLLHTLLPDDLKYCVKAETESVDEFIEFVLRVIRSSSKERECEKECNVSSDINSQDDFEFLDDEMPVLENCTAYVSNISSNISSPPVPSRFQSLSDSGIVHDQSFTCEATCETISVKVDFANDQTSTSENVLDSKYMDFISTAKSEEVLPSGTIPDGTHMIIGDDIIKDNGEVCSTIMDEDVALMDVDSPLSESNSTTYKVPQEDCDVDQDSKNCDDMKNNDEVSTSDISANICESNVHVLDKLASVLSNSDSKCSPRSDPLMDLLKDKKNHDTESEFGKTVQSSTPDVVTDHIEVKSSTEQSTVKVIEVFEPSIVLCKKPKKCLKMFMKKIHSLLHRLLPGVHFEHHFFRNSNNLEYLLDAIIQTNQQLSV